GHRDALLARVGPVVAVVEVDEEAHPRVLDLLAEVDGVRDVVVAVRLVVAVRRLRIDERAQPDVVEAVRLHDRQQVAAGGDRLRFLVGDVGADVEAEGQRVHAAAARARGPRRSCAGAGPAAPARAGAAAGPAVATAPPGAGGAA